MKGGVLLGWKQQKQLVITTFRGVRANLPVQRSVVELGRGREGCLYSCSSEESQRFTWRLQGCISGQSKAVKVADVLKAMFDGKNVDRRFGNAIINPIVFVGQKDFSDFRPFEVREGFVSEFRIFGKRFNRCCDIFFPSIGIVGVELARNVAGNGYETLAGARRPVDFHTATFRIRRVRFLRLARTSCMKSSCDTPSPLLASPSATRRSSYVSSLSRISSNAETSMNTYAARPFWVRINGRLVSFARDAHEASVVRNSLMEMISSDGLNSNMAFSPLISMVSIVRNCVHNVKRVARGSSAIGFDFGREGCFYSCSGCLQSELAA